MTNIIAFYDNITGWIEEGKAVNTVYLNLSKNFNDVSHSILTAKLKKYGLDD